MYKTKAFQVTSSGIMTFQNLLTSLVILLFSVSAHANDQSRRNSECSKKNVDLVTRDVIALSMREIRQTREFVHSIPRLKSVQEKDSKELLDCVVGLIDCLSDLQSILHRMRHLKASSINLDANSLMGMVSRVLGFNQVCHLPSNDVDGRIATMLDQKLVDSAMLINNVVNAVSALQLESATAPNP